MESGNGGGGSLFQHFRHLETVERYLAIELSIRRAEQHAADAAGDGLVHY